MTSLKELIASQKPEFHKKNWGNELWIANTSLYCGKILNLNEGWQCSIHFHKVKDETFYILGGIVVMGAYDEEIVMKPGDTLRIVPGTKHCFTGLKDSKIIEISTHHEEGDSYRIVESRKVSGDEFKRLKKKYKAYL